MTGRKRVEGAMAGGRCGLTNKQCLKIAPQTRKCHENGTFFKFERRTIAAIILEVLPGPVKNEVKFERRLTREAPIARRRRIDFRGSLVADAMMKVQVLLTD